MNRVINGKRYDTDTAKAMGYDQYSYPRDFNYWKETLYRKQTGEYFLYGEGGPNSKYRTYSSENSWGGGEKITPLTLEEAQKWAEKHLNGDEYEAIFGSTDETGERQNVTITLDRGTFEKMKRMAAEKGVSSSEVIERLIQDAPINFIPTISQGSDKPADELFDDFERMNGLGPYAPDDEKD